MKPTKKRTTQISRVMRNILAKNPMITIMDIMRWRR